MDGFYSNPGRNLPFLFVGLYIHERTTPALSKCGVFLPMMGVLPPSPHLTGPLSFAPILLATVARLELLNTSMTWIPCVPFFLQATITGRDGEAQDVRDTYGGRDIYRAGSCQGWSARRHGSCGEHPDRRYISRGISVENTLCFNMWAMASVCGLTLYIPGDQSYFFFS